MDVKNMTQEVRNRNEIMQGPAPQVLNVLRIFNPQHAAYYADGDQVSVLIPALSERFGITHECIIVGYGAEDLLRTIFNELDSSKDSVLTHEYYYGYYKSYLENRGIALKTFKMQEEQDTFSFDIADCLRQYEAQHPKVILITSPNNPTGNTIEPNELELILKAVRPETLVVLDEAYWGFDEEYDERAMLSFLDRYPNLMIIRSFSKYYALAGLRIGFALCGTAVKSMLRYQDTYLGVSRLLEEVAAAALSADEYYRNIATQIRQEREYMKTEINKLSGFKAYKSRSNLLFILSSPELLLCLEQAIKSLEILSIKKSIGNHWRITVGLPEVNRELIKVLQKVNAG